MLAKYSKYIAYNPLKVIFISMAILVAASVGIGHLSFKSDLRIYFSDENPQVKMLDHMEQTYTKTDSVLFILAPKNGVFNREVLSVVEELTKKAWLIPFSSRVDSLTNFKHSSAIEDDIVVDDLVINATTLTANGIERVRTIATAEPLLVNSIISPDQQVTGINVTINIPKGKELSSVPVVVKYVRELATEIQMTHPDIDIYLTGVVMMDNAFSEATEKDMKTLVPAMLVIALIIMGTIMRSWLASLAAMLILTFSIVAAMGLAGWLGVLLNPISVNAPNIILTLAICDCVHLLMAYFLGLRNGLVKQEAMSSALISTFNALLITTLSTCVGFLTLNYSEAPPFRDLGNITTLGVAMAFVFTVTFLPAFMMLFPVSNKHTQKIQQGRLESKINSLAEAIIAAPKKYFTISMLFVVVACAGIFNNTLNDEFVKYFDESVKFRQDTDFTSEHLTGIYYIDYEIGGTSQDGINSPEYLKTLEQFTQWYRQQPEVLHVNSMADIYKRLNMNMNGDDKNKFTMPTNNELAAQYLLLYEMSLPYGLDLRNRVNASKDATRVTATLKNLSSNEVLDLEARAQSWLQSHSDSITFSEGTGLTVMFANIGLRNIIGMLSGMAIALVVISLMLIIVFRSIKYGIISLIPNLLPAAVAFGIWGYLVGQVGLALSVMAAMTLGIVVDDTVHFLTKYIHARRDKNMHSADAIRYAFSNVGAALVITTLALTAGFAVLGLSSFEINAGMGILTAMAISFALVLDMLLLPALLLLVDSKQHNTQDENQIDFSADTQSSTTVPELAS